MKRELLLGAVPLLLSPAMAWQAYAEVYMSDAQAAAAIFPGKVFERTTIELTSEELKQIEQNSKENVRAKQLTIWKTKDRSFVFIDQALGKHEFITYAVGIDQSGKVAGIEIIEYRETYGQQVRKPEWRSQFVGKGTEAHLKLNDDIKNISGATLSSAHITGGVKRILHTYDAIHGRL